MNRVAPTALAVWLALCAAAASAQSQPRLLPVDQAASVPGFFTFRAQLQAAIARHDADAVIAALHSNVKLSFGGDAGVEAFKKIWKPAEPDSRLWEVLAAVLALGGTFAADGSFTAPYVFSRWPEAIDSFTHRAAIGSGIRVRASPSTDAAVVGALHFSIVEVAEPPAPDAAWVPVKLATGAQGYVDARYLRSPIDYRVIVSKVGGRWQIMMLLAGD